MVEPLQQLDPLDERWAAFVAAPQANIFHHPAWLQLLAECYHYRPFIAAYGAGGAIQAGVPMMEVRSPLTGPRWVALPFTDHCQPLCGDHPEALAGLAEGVVWLSHHSAGHRVEVRWPLPPHPAIQTRCENVWHSVALTPDVEAVTRRFHSAHRRNVRLAHSRGARVQWVETRAQWKEYYRLHVLTRCRQGMPAQPWSFFDLLGRRLLNTGLGFALLAVKDNETLAGAVFLRWGETLTYKYGASSRAGRELQPNHLLFDTAIRWGCDHGCTLFDLGRTDPANAGLRSFKSRWGAREAPLAYSVLPPAAHAVAAGPLLRDLNWLIRHAPPWVARISGEVLYRHFG